MIMIQEENSMNFQKIKNKIEEVYTKLISSNNLSEDLLDVNENYECFLINGQVNSKLFASFNTVDKNNVVYGVEEAKKLVNDEQYCNRWLEIVKSYLFCVGVDVESDSKTDLFDLVSVSKSLDKFKTVISSIKLVAQLAIETRNLKLFDQVFDIYCAVFEAQARNPNKAIEQAIFALENSVEKTPLLVHYHQFCKDRLINGIFSDLENQINGELNKQQTKSTNLSGDNLNNQQALTNKAFGQEQSLPKMQTRSLDQALNDLNNQQINGQKLDLTSLVSDHQNSIANNYTQQQLTEALLNQQYKNNFLKFVNLFFLKIGINFNTNSGSPVASFINKEELEALISAIKITASFAKNSDQEYFQQLENNYEQIYQKFTDSGLLDHEDGFSECFYTLEMNPKQNKIANEYSQQNPQGVFHSVESSIDQERYDNLISNNIKKFDEKTIKFYTHPYVDIRLENSANNQDYQVQIIFDGNATTFEQVAKEFGQDPYSLKDWQKKNTSEGLALSFTHEATAKYLGIKQGEELNHTLLAIRDQARQEAEILSDFEIDDENLEEDLYANESSLQNKKFSEFTASDFEEELDDEEELYMPSTQSKASSASLSDHSEFSESAMQFKKITDVESQINKSTMNSNQLFDDYQASEESVNAVNQIHSYFVDNFSKIEDFFKIQAVVKVIELLVNNPSLKIETTSNPVSKEVRHQLMFVFKEGFNSKTIEIISNALANGERKEWQLSQSDQAKSRGFAGSFIIPHDYSAKILGVRNPSEINQAIEKIFEFAVDLDLLNLSLIQYLRSDFCSNVLREFIRNDFAMSFDYSEQDNIFSKKTITLIATNDVEREAIYDFVGFGKELNKSLTSQQLEEYRKSITTSSGDIILNDAICSSLFNTSDQVAIDSIIRKMESFLQANKRLCDSFNANEHESLLYLLELNDVANEDFADDEYFESESNTSEQLQKVYV